MSSNGDNESKALSSISTAGVSTEAVHSSNMKQQHNHTKTQVLSDGTVVTSCKKKGILSDGSAIVKSIVETIPSVSNSSKLDQAEHVVKKTRSKIRHTKLDLFQSRS